MPRLPAPGLILLAAALVPVTLGVHAVEWIAGAALVVILFNGGMDIGWARMRTAAGPVLSLGALGTFATAALIALAAHALLGYSWTLAGIVGAALAPTDPAVVFSVLGGTTIHSRAGTILEGEAGFNDPAGIALMLGMIDLATHPGSSFTVVIVEFVRQMAIGGVFGAVAGKLLPRTRGAVLRLAIAFALYGVTALAGGSGFLAVFIAGLLLADAHEFHGRVASAAEIVVFVALGLTVDLVAVGGDAWRDGAVLMGVLAFAIRPLVVLAGLVAAKLDDGDRAFIAWGGLKGAVPILLAAFALVDHVDGARRLYAVVFVAVLLSVFGQGSTVPAVARRFLS